MAALVGAPLLGSVLGGFHEAGRLRRMIRFTLRRSRGALCFRIQRGLRLSRTIPRLIFSPWSAALLVILASTPAPAAAAAASTSALLASTLFQLGFRFD